MNQRSLFLTKLKRFGKPEPHSKKYLKNNLKANNFPTQRSGTILSAIKIQALNKIDICVIICKMYVILEIR